MYTFRRGGIQVDVQAQNADDVTDGHQTPEEEVSQIDEGSEAVSEIRKIPERS